jgi:hypothetical protein
MSTRRITTGVTVAVLVASLAACGSAADPNRDGESAAARTGPAADASPLAVAATRLAPLRRPRTAEDRWPADDPASAGDALIVDRGAARRLFAAGSPPYGLWLVPGRPQVEPTAAEAPMTDVCLRVLLLSGANRGGEASSCRRPDEVARDGALLVTMTADARPRWMALAGTVPDGVRSVRLVDTRTGTAERHPIHDNAFVFETTRSPKELHYRIPGEEPVARPIEPAPTAVD